MERGRIVWTGAALLGAVLVAASVLPRRMGTSDAGTRRPRLVVLVAIDRFPAADVARSADLFARNSPTGEPRGFRFLMERGAWYPDARRDLAPCAARAHGDLVTAAATRPPEECTVGDELKISTGGRAKVWALAFGDRAAVHLAGRLADGALWLDAERGTWTSGHGYFEDGRLPAWAQASRPATGPTPGRGTKDLPPDVLSRAGTKSVLELAADLMDAEALGADDVPDLLAIDLSGADSLGRARGHDGSEALAMSAETDRLLADFMDDVALKTPGGWSSVTFVVAADQGDACAPGAPVLFAGCGVREAGLRRGSVSARDVAATLADELAVPQPNGCGGRRLPHAVR